MWKIFFLLSIFMSTPSLAKHCDIEFVKLGLCGKIQFEKKISRKSSSDFVLKLTKKDEVFFPQEKLNIFLHMKMKNGHDHGSTDVLVMKRQEDYLIKDVWFLMDGVWQIHFELRQAGKIIDKAIHSVCVGTNCRVEHKIEMH